ncbi:MAG TPA: hypothetical protein VFM70_07070 [Salinimicrobium sp.]|nr:hypothetical protein [Salinimicrobium sp.]
MAVSGKTVAVSGKTVAVPIIRPRRSQKITIAIPINKPWRFQQQNVAFQQIKHVSSH